MKKALAILLALALVGPAAFAEISDMFSIGSWGRALWDVAGKDGDNVESTLHQSWGGDAPRTSLTINGDADNVSYMLDIFANGSELGVGDNAYIEIRPFSPNFFFQAAILVGKSDINEARSDAAFGIYNWDRIGSANSDLMDQEGFIFDDLLDVDGGVSLRLYPVPGLTVGVGIPLMYSEANGTFIERDDDDEITNITFPMDKLDIANVWGNANYYISYELPANIGKIRVGYDSKVDVDLDGDRGDLSDLYDPWGIIGAAFEFTMVDNLYVAVGAKIPTHGEVLDGEWTEGDYGAAAQVNAYVNYNLGFFPLGFHVLFGSKINAWDQNKNRGAGDDGAFGFQIGLGIDWEIIENVPLFVDVRYANGVYMDNDSGDDNDCWTFGVGISKLWANAELGIAFEMATNGYGNPNGYHAALNSRGERDLTWAIPVKFEYSF